MHLTKHIAQRRLFEVRQAQAGIIRAVKTGKPGANFLSGQIRPLQIILNDAEWQANAELFELELEAV